LLIREVFIIVFKSVWTSGSITCWKIHVPRSKLLEDILWLFHSQSLTIEKFWVPVEISYVPLRVWVLKRSKWHTLLAFEFNFIIAYDFFIRQLTLLNDTKQLTAKVPRLGTPGFDDVKYTFSNCALRHIWETLYFFIPVTFFTIANSPKRNFMEYL